MGSAPHRPSRMPTLMMTGSSLWPAPRPLAGAATGRALTQRMRRRKGGEETRQRRKVAAHLRGRPSCPATVRGPGAAPPLPAASGFGPGNPLTALHATALGWGMRVLLELRPPVAPGERILACAPRGAPCAGFLCSSCGPSSSAGGSCAAAGSSPSPQPSPALTPCAPCSSSSGGGLSTSSRQGSLARGRALPWRPAKAAGGAAPCPGGPATGGGLPQGRGGGGWQGPVLAAA